MEKLLDITRSYLAGLADGKGYFGICKVKSGNKKYWGMKRDYTFRAEINITNTNKAIIDWLKTKCSGYTDSREHSQPNRKRSYAWEARKTIQCKEFIDLVYPYLRIKKPQADILKRFFATFVYHQKGSKGVLTYENWQIREQLYKEIRALNKRGI